MYVGTSDGIIWEAATLELKQILQPSSSKCELEFWHHTIDEHFLNVILVEGDDAISIWQETSASGDQWMRVLLPIGRITRPWTIRFLAEKGWGNGAIAIDDIRLLGCEFPAIQPTCSDDQFRCNRGACISKDLLCDFS